MTIDRTMMGLIEVWQKRSTCPRLSTACVAASPDGQVYVSGYNGAPSREDHCADVGCLMDGGRCIRAVHDVQNAIAQAARFGVMLEGAHWWVSHSPCALCAKLLVQVQAERVFVVELYRATEPAEKYAMELLSRRTELVVFGGNYETDWRVKP